MLAMQAAWRTYVEHNCNHEWQPSQHVTMMMSDTRHGWIHLESIPSRSLHQVDRGELVQSQITCSVIHDTHMPIAQGAYRDIIVCMLITMRVMCNTCNTTFATCHAMVRWSVHQVMTWCHVWSGPPHHWMSSCRSAHNNDNHVCIVRSGVVCTNGTTSITALMNTIVVMLQRTTTLINSECLHPQTMSVDMSRIMTSGVDGGEFGESTCYQHVSLHVTTHL